MSILEVNDISKSFNSIHAVNNVSFKIEPGQIHGILGPNGAGKTTTIRMIMNILTPDSGTISLFGQTMNEQLKKKIGYLPEERGLYQKMKIKDLIYFMAELHKMDASKAREKCDYCNNRALIKCSLCGNKACSKHTFSGFRSICTKCKRIKNN